MSFGGKKRKIFTWCNIRDIIFAIFWVIYVSFSHTKCSDGYWSKQTYITTSYCFTLFICGGPSHLSSFKQCAGNRIFLWERLVYSLEFVLLPHWYYRVRNFFSKNSIAPLECTFLPWMSQFRWHWRVSAFILELHLYVPPVYAKTRHYYHHAGAQKYQQK